MEKLSGKRLDWGEKIGETNRVGLGEAEASGVVRIFGKFYDEIAGVLSFVELLPAGLLSKLSPSRPSQVHSGKFYINNENHQSSCL